MKESVIKNCLSTLFFPLTLSNKIFFSKDFPPKGTMVDLGANIIHAIVSGKGKPIIILEAGMGGCALDWSLVQQELSTFATVVSYDRPGYGWSDGIDEKMTGLDHVHHLRKLLKKLNLKPPYILVGHSYGGISMQLFASKYPNETAALILVDSVYKDWYLPENMTIARKRALRKSQLIHKLGFYLSPLGIPKLYKLHVGSKRLPLNLLKVTSELGYRPKAYKTIYLELAKAEESARQIEKMQPIHESIPITIISAGKQMSLWKEQQTLLCSLNGNTEQIVVENSWHSIHILEPDAVIKVVTDAALAIKEAEKEVL